jgi:hypothetical protein
LDDKSKYYGSDKDKEEARRQQRGRGQGRGEARQGEQAWQGAKIIEVATMRTKMEQATTRASMKSMKRQEDDEEARQDHWVRMTSQDHGGGDEDEEGRRWTHILLRSLDSKEKASKFIWGYWKATNEIKYGFSDKPSIYLFAQCFIFPESTIYIVGNS